MATPNWIPVARDYDRDHEKLALEKSSATSHPLLLNRPKPTVTVSEKSIGGSSGKSPVKPASSASADPLADPLSGAIRDPLSDPLAGGSSAPIIDDPLSGAFNSRAGQVETKTQAIENVRQAALELHESNLNSPWQAKKLQIRKDYTITGNITLNSSAISEFAGSGVEDGSSTRRVDKYDKRLANLEKRDATADEKIEMSQKEYESHVHRLTNDLSKAWAKDERVGSLKIAIQLAKLLGDTNMPSFYPSIFVIVTDALDKFGEMVYSRLFSRAEDALNTAANLPAGSKKKLKLSSQFTCQDVPMLARDTCRNWFYKVSCIRELLPRIYIEIALMKCYRFLTDNELPSIITRIGSIIRGLGDPLVNSYARLYLVVIANDVMHSIPNTSGIPTNAAALSMFQDLMFSFPMIKDPSNVAELERKKLPLKSYHFVMSPVIEWMLKYISPSNVTGSSSGSSVTGSNKELFQNVLQLYRDHSNESVVLKHIIDSFDASYYAHAATGMVTLIKASEPTCFSTVDLLTSLGRQFAIFPPPEESRLIVLNDVWKVVSKSQELSSYVKCTAAWLDVVQKYYSEREMIVLLGHFSGRVTAATPEQLDTVMPLIEGLLTSLIGQSSTFGTAVLTSEHLLKILDVFKGPKKVQLCKEILESFKSSKTTNDPVLINTVFDLARVIHDSVDGLSAVSDVNYNSLLLCNFIDQIDFGRDLEQQLNFYVECRAAFANLEAVKDKLVVCVSALAMRAFRYVKGKHTKKTTTFVKASLAYCHITIPSLTDVFRKLELLLQCAQVALLNQCLPQTDTFLKAAISLIPELNGTSVSVASSSGGNEPGAVVLTTSAEERLAEYANHLLAFLVLAPGHPEHGPFYIVQGLMNALPKFAWNPANPYKNRIYINMLLLLCSMSQKRLPYHIHGVQSNDELYGGAKGYMVELEEMIAGCIAEILKQMTSLGESTSAGLKDAKLLQARSAMDLAHALIVTMEVQSKQDITEFIYKLIDLANRQRNLSFTRQDNKYFQLIVELLIRRLEDDCVEDYALVAVPKLKAFLTSK